MSLQVKTSLINLDFNNSYSVESKVLDANWNEGFFSNCSTALWALTDLKQMNHVPVKIRIESGWDNFRDNNDKNDLYSVFFKAQKKCSFKRSYFPLEHINPHANYREIFFGRYLEFTDCFFKPNEKIEQIINSFIKKYDINPKKTIAVCYRGTDKVREVDIAEPDLYVSVVKKILKNKKYRDHKVFIQTDQAQVRDMFIEHFGDNCFFIDEMPVTASSKVIHSFSSEQLGLSKQSFAQNLIAVVNIAARCNVIVNHTGNVALWICLYRRTCKNMYQFNSLGNLILPPVLPTFFYYLNRYVRYVKRKIKNIFLNN